LSSDFDETWHMYSLIFIFSDRGKIRGKEGKYALPKVFNGFLKNFGDMLNSQFLTGCCEKILIKGKIGGKVCSSHSS